MHLMFTVVTVRGYRTGLGWSKYWSRSFDLSHHQSEQCDWPRLWLMAQSQCRGSILFSRRRRKYRIGDQSSKKTYKESVVTLWEISYRILTWFDGKFVRSAPDQPPIISDTFADRLLVHLRRSATISEAPVDIVRLVAGRFRCNRRAPEINRPFLIAIGGCNPSHNRAGRRRFLGGSLRLIGGCRC